MPRRWPFAARLLRLEPLFFIGVFIFVLICWNSSVALQLSRGFNTRDGLNPLPREGFGGGAADPTNQIYLVKDPSAGIFTLSDWKHISKAWVSKSTYRELLNLPGNARDMFPPRESPSERIAFMLHNYPKMASTTLRRACWENQRATCNFVSMKRDPAGYSNAKDLADLLAKCDHTHHFCVMGWHFNPENFPNTTSPSPRTFIHLFPFRNHDDWAASAMKQVFVGHGEAGCNQIAKRLDGEKCEGWLELDFDKYTKPAIARMMRIKTSQQHRHQTHHFVLYDYSRVKETIAQLSGMFKIPTLTHLDAHHKQIRRNGTCPVQTLQKYHECSERKLSEV